MLRSELQHERNVIEILTIIGPRAPMSALTLLMCTGLPEFCRVSPVSIGKEVVDPVTQWRLAH